MKIVGVYFHCHHPTTPPGGLTGRIFAVGLRQSRRVEKFLYIINILESERVEEDRENNRLRFITRPMKIEEDRKTHEFICL